MEMKAVKSVLSSHWDGRLPVRPDIIAHRMGIDVNPLPVSYSGSEPCGMAEITWDGRMAVYYNKSDSHSRIRFTLAHELGHHILGHTKYQAKFRDYPGTLNNTGNSLDEREANRFAAELLMPEEAIDTMINNEGIHSIDALASTFDVSRDAMYWRLKNLNYV
ncbi:ImmA/IrrE family metallo-endopeptidase [Dickeya dadantii]|uniref:ImmA/IrrE family metallo-endopeptidase n=1 Tax=Dickeya dadantii TaxID=204038 RepID=UPI0005765290|nr:ImmA/IrrE family metallo-endopeptidase [Dickeya dadantii]